MMKGSFTRTVTGLITLFIYAVIGVLAWPGLPWLTYGMGVLGAIRLVLLVRQLPGRVP